MAKGVGGMGSFGKKFGDIQKRMAEMQESLKTRIVDGSSGGGVVTAFVNGRKELVSVKLDPSVVDPDDVEMLEDLVMAAVAEAQNKARTLYEEEMKKATGGLPMQLPGLF